MGGRVRRAEAGADHVGAGIPLGGRTTSSDVSPPGSLIRLKEVTVRSLPVLALLGLTAVPASSQSRVPAAPPMSPVQTQLFNLPGSLSNAWGDFDNDGDLDLAISSTTGLRLYRNERDGFVSVGEVMGLPAASYEIRGLSWGDYDGDGWLDLIAGPIAADRATMVFHNERGKRFTEVAAQVGLTIPGRSARI